MTTNVIPLRPDMPEPPVVPRHHASLEVWMVQERIVPTEANDDHWRWLSTVAGSQARDLLDAYERTMHSLIADAAGAGHLAAGGFLTATTRGPEAIRVALLAALSEEIAERTTADSGDVLAGGVETA